MEDVLSIDRTLAETSPYRPLDTEKAVRFLELLPGASDEPLSVKLLHDSLITTLQRAYEATSYTWGDPLPTKTLRCDGKTIEVRRNAYDFLERLRLQDESRILWMDCICIDQDNVAEREDQVKIMHLIYRKAKRVLAWLGPESHDSTLAMEYISRLEPDRYLKEIRRALQWGGMWLYGKSFLFDSFPKTAENMRLVTSFANLLCRPWIRRVWIQQEAALCSKAVVCCGQQEVSWDQLSSLVWLMTATITKDWPSWTTECVTEHTSSELLSSSLLAAGCISNNRMSHQLDSSTFTENELTESAEVALVALSEHPLEWLERRTAEVTLSRPTVGIERGFLDVLKDFSGLEATDPRDKIYALFNLVHFGSHDLSGRPEIDYTAPWQVIYIRFAKWMYTRKWHRTIESAGRLFQVKPEVPSWVPDWRHKVVIALQTHEEWFAGGAAYSFNPQFVALQRARNGSVTLPVYSYIDQKGKRKRIASEGLELNAIIQDRICYTSLANSSKSEHLVDSIEQIRCRVESDLQFLSDHEIGYFTGESAKDAYAATLIANTTHEENLATAEYERCGFAQWREWLAAGGKARPGPVYEDAIDNAESLGTNTFCVTAHGLFCLAPRLAQAGDYIAILSGFKFPVALRKVGPATEKYYELLGPCYVNRLMRGRAWSLIDEFKCKYRPGSGDEIFDENPRTELSQHDTDRDQPCGVHPFNSKGDYARLTRIMGKRRIVLV